MKPTVVVTRPEDDGDRLGSRLHDAGWPVFVQPIIRIAPLADDTLPSTPEFESDDRVIFISANAVSYGLPHLEASLKSSGAKVLAVGERTASGLRAAGFDVVVPTMPNSEGLLALPELNNFAGQRVVIVKGDGGRQFLAEALIARSAVVLEYVCYRREVEPVDAETFCEGLIAAEPLVFQANSGETLTRLTELLAEGGQPNLSHQPVVVPSARLVDFAATLGWTSVWIADDASDQALLTLLASRLDSELSQEDVMAEEAQVDDGDDRLPVAVEKDSDEDMPIAATPSQPPRKSSGDGLARSLSILALLLLCGAGGLGVWQGQQWLKASDTRLQGIDASLTELTAQRAAQGDALAATEQRLQQSIDQRLVALAEADSQSQGQLRDAAQQSRVAQAEALRRFDNRLAELEAQLARLTGTDRRAWLLQESAFLVRLASQRLLVARDIDAAEALLGNADDLLLQANDPSFDAARRAVALDRAALRGLTRVDVVGLHARLAALINEAEEVAVATLTTAAPVRAAGDLASSTLLERAKVSWQLALAKLSGYVIVRDRTEETAALLTPEWEALARQNLRMLLEQGQIALISGNQALYSTAISSAVSFAQGLRPADPARVDAILADLAQLANVTVAPTLPNLQASRQALDDAVRTVLADSVVN